MLALLTSNNFACIAFLLLFLHCLVIQMVLSSVYRIANSIYSPYFSSWCFMRENIAFRDLQKKILLKSLESVAGHCFNKTV